MKSSNKKQNNFLNKSQRKGEINMFNQTINSNQKSNNSILLKKIRKGNADMTANNLFGLLIKSMMILTIIYFSLPFSYAQATSMWAKRYNGTGTGYDNAYSVASDPMGNVYVTGASMGTGTGLDYCTIKYGPDGMPSPSWPDMGFGIGVRRFNGPVSGFDEAYKIAVDLMGNVYVTGFVDNGTPTSIDYCTIKYSPSGIMMWVMTYDGGAGGGHDFPYALAVDAMGNVYVTGASPGDPMHIDYNDYCTIKYSPAGVMMWAARFDGPAHKDDEALAIKLDAAGNVYVTGYSDFGLGEAINFMTIKYSPGGAIMWAAKYNDDLVMNNDYGYDLALDATGNVYVTGVTVASGNKSYSTVKYTPSGVLAWSKKYDGPGFDDIPTAIAVDISGNIIVTGKSDEAGAHDFAYSTIKYSPSGVVIWSTRYVGTGVNDEPSAMVLDKFGNVYVTGKSLGSTHYDYTTVKYDSAGVQKWLMSYNGLWGSADDEANAIALDSMGNVIVTGFSSNSPGGPITDDYATIKYSQPLTGISGNENETAKDFSLQQNYPNPFNPSTNIKYSIAENTNVKIAVYDITGKEVTVLVDKNQNAGTYEIRFDGSNFSSGVYFYKITTEGFTEVRKMTLVK